MLRSILPNRMGVRSKAERQYANAPGPARRESIDEFYQWVFLLPALSLDPITLSSPRPSSPHAPSQRTQPAAHTRYPILPPTPPTRNNLARTSISPGLREADRPYDALPSPIAMSVVRSFKAQAHALYKTHGTSHPCPRSAASVSFSIRFIALVALSPLFDISFLTRSAGL
jgi:hypothetical protein